MNASIFLNMERIWAKCYNSKNTFTGIYVKRDINFTWNRLLKSITVNSQNYSPRCKCFIMERVILQQPG